MMINDSSIIRRADNLLTSHIDNEVVILGLSGGKYTGLNEMGTFIWDRLESEIRVEELIDALAEQYDPGKQQIREDVIDFLNHLSDKSLIQIRNEDNHP